MDAGSVPDPDDPGAVDGQAPKRTIAESYRSGTAVSSRAATLDDNLLHH